MTANIDKGVCTNDVLEDLHRAIKFEAVFSTLIENKILAIKEECQEKGRQKRPRSLVRFLFGRQRNIASSIGDPNIEAFQAQSPNGTIPAAAVVVSALSTPGQIETNEYRQPTHPLPSQWCTVAQENEKIQSVLGDPSGHSLKQQRTAESPVSRIRGERGSYVVEQVNDTVSDENVAKGEVGTDNCHCSPLEQRRRRLGGRGRGEVRRPESNPELEYKYDAISIQSDTCRYGCGRGGLPNDIIHTAKRQYSRVIVSGVASDGASRDKRSQSDDFIARNKQSQEQCSRSSLRQDGPTSETGPRVRSINYDTEKVVVSPPPSLPRAMHSKSILTSSSSSLQSTLNDGRANDHKGTHNVPQVTRFASSPINTSSLGEMEQPPNKLSPREASIVLEQERNRLRVFEMRSISAQCSPIMPRHIEFDSAPSLSNSAPNSLHPVYDEENNSNRSMIDATPVKTHRRHNHKSKTHRAAEYLAAQIDFDSLANYPMVNPMTQGIISSFNQLKSPNLPKVIPMKQMTKTSLISETQPPAKSKKGDTSQVVNSMASTGVDTGHSAVATTCCVGAEKNRKGHRSSGQSKGGRDDENNEPPQRQSIICDRNMDAIEYHPSSSTSGKRQCILSRHPNEPIEIEYSEDFLYDTSIHSEELRMGRDVAENGIRDNRFDSIMEEAPKGRHRHHNHQHHHHRHRHKHKHHQGDQKKKKKRRKILVHDLDDQSIKVIDPDDLPKRARWTIIATACLLLVMCLALVGVTLRMAPIIDDMVRQENERLQLESLNRAKFARNFSDTPSSFAAAAAQEDIP